MKNKKKNEKSLVDTLIGLLPAVVLSLVVFPLLGYFSYAIYASSILGSTNTVFNVIMLLITIMVNLIALLGLFYVVNIMWETDIRKHLLVGGVFLSIVIIIAIIKYVAYTKAEAGADAILAFDNFRLSRGIAIGYTAYYIIAIFINKIAQISVKNKGIKASK